MQNNLHKIMIEKRIDMKQKFLKDLGIDIDDATEDVLKQFDLNGFMDQISDNRLKDEKDQFDEITKNKDEANNKNENKNDK